MKIRRWPLWGLVALLGLGTIAALFGGCSSPSMAHPGMTSGTGGAAPVATGGSAGTTTNATGGAPNTGGAPGLGGAGGAGGPRIELLRMSSGDNGPSDMYLGPGQTLLLSSRYCGGIGRLSATGEVLPGWPLPEAKLLTLRCSIAAAPDGNVWFGRWGTIGRVAPSGEVTEFPLLGGTKADGTPADGVPVAIAAGPDGNVWFTESQRDYVGRVTPEGVITEFPMGAVGRLSDPGAIVAGPDGNLWFRDVASNRIGRLSPAGELAEFLIPGTAGEGGIAVGADGVLWFTEITARAIGRITTAGVITEFPLAGLGGMLSGPLTVGANGDVWFAEYGSVGRVGRMTTAGTVTEFPIESSSGYHSERVTALVTNLDGSIWFSSNSTFTFGLGRIIP